MNDEPNVSAAEPAFFERMMRYQDNAVSPEELAAFEDELRTNAKKRALFAETQMRSMTLHEQLREEAFRVVAPVGRVNWLPAGLSRPFAAAAAGLVSGLFCASLAWAVAAPRAVLTMERVLALAAGGFEGAPGRVPTGFPRAAGAWGGDDAEIVSGEAKEGAQRLRFVSPGADDHDPNGRAISCDVFQLVDLRPLRAQRARRGESVLELSASFLDARARGAKPTVTFFCQMYLFRGDLSAMHQTWPQNLAEALASSSEQTTTLGSDGKGWRMLTAKCFVPEQADFAVVQIAARPNLRPAPLEGLYADDVRLSLKTSPELPVRIVQHPTP